MGVLQQIRADLGQCTRCSLHEGRRTVVFGSGPANADLMIVTGAPNEESDRIGLPMLGDEREIFDRMLENVLGLTRGEVFITYVVKCRVMGTKAPPIESVLACRPVLDQQVAAISPRVILVMGGHAVRSLWSGQGTVDDMRGQWRTYASVPTMVTHSPGYLQRYPEYKVDALTDLECVKSKLDEVVRSSQVPADVQIRKLSSEVAGFKARGVELAKQLVKLSESNNELRRELAKRFAPPPAATAAISAPKLQEEQLMKLIRLCHPDRHQDETLSEIASEMTKWLLEQRQKKPRKP